MLNTKDTEVLRQLAEKYMSYATTTQQDKTRKLWYSLNRLQMQKPMVLIDQICWEEFEGQEELRLRCEDPLARSAERSLREILYRWKHFRADTLFEPFWRIRMAYDSTGMGISREENIIRSDEFNNIVSHQYRDVLEEEEALEDAGWEEEEEEELEEAFSSSQRAVKVTSQLSVALSLSPGW